jgi:hypothetical protein
MPSAEEEALYCRIAAALVSRGLSFQTTLARPPEHPDGIRLWQFTLSGPMPPINTDILEVPLLLVGTQNAVSAAVAIEAQNPIDDIFSEAVQRLCETVPFVRLVRSEPPHAALIRTDLPIESSTEKSGDAFLVTTAWQTVLTACHMLVAQFPGRFNLVKAVTIPILRLPDDQPEVH